MLGSSSERVATLDVKCLTDLLFFFPLNEKFSSQWRGVGGWMEGSVSMSSLQFHFLQTLEHRTDVSVTSTSPRWEAPEERGPAWVPATPLQCSG